MERSTEAQARQEPDLLSNSEAENSLSHQDRDRLLHEAYCADRATLLSGSYRRDDANSPEIYIQAITMVLSEFPRAVVEFSTDPRTGLQAQEQFRAFMPNSGEVRAFCNAEVARGHRMARPAPKLRQHYYVPPRTSPGCRANLLILFEAPQYAVVKAFVDSGECDSRDFENTDRGVKIALSVFENLAGGRIQARHVGEARR